MVATLEGRVLDATKACCERFGFAKLSVDDVAAEAGVSRATIYRLYPGGKDVLLEALRVRELEEFFADLRAGVVGVESLEELLVRTVVTATRALRDDHHLAVMLAAEPGEALTQLTTAGVPRIIDYATSFLVPFAEPYLFARAIRRPRRRAQSADDLLLPRPERPRRSRRPRLRPPLPRPPHQRAHQGAMT